MEVVKSLADELGPDVMKMVHQVIGSAVCVVTDMATTGTTSGMLVISKEIRDRFTDQAKAAKFLHTVGKYLPTGLADGTFTISWTRGGGGDDDEDAWRFAWIMAARASPSSSSPYAIGGYTSTLGVFNGGGVRVGVYMS